MDALERLRDKINNINQSVHKRVNAVPFGQPQLMTMAKAEVRKVFDTMTSNLSERSIAKVLSEYRNSGSLSSFLDLKYACRGVGQGLTDGWCLFDDDRLFFKLLDQVKVLLPEPRRFRKCYQGLLASYLSYAIFESESKKNWEHLRGYLAEHLRYAKKAMPASSWLTLLEEHKNLLGSKPCERYARELREGDSTVVYQTLQDGLGVPRDSWLWQELVVSQVEVACNHDDKDYQDDLERLLRMLHANSMMLSENLTISCIAMLVSRYAQCSSKPEHPALRDAAVTHIGNPWLKKTAWDAHVRTKDGQPHDAARQMVNGWIKRELIKNFFELLSDDGTADPRRLNYWLRFEPVIEDMWFALGPYANRHTNPDFKDFRNLARGRLLELESPGVAQNNAFIMRLGALTVVEFGALGNAVYMYPSEELPFDLSKRWISGNSTGFKNQSVGKRFIHRGTDWEENLDAILCPLIGLPIPPMPRRVVRRRANRAPQPETTTRRPAQVKIPSITTWEREVKAFAEIYGLAVEDNRLKGGAFWVLVDGANYHQLAKLGFKFKPGKGWWKEK